MVFGGIIRIPMADICSAYCVSGTVLGTLYILSHVNLIQTLQGKNIYFLHFTDKEIGTEMLSNLPYLS